MTFTVNKKLSAQAAASASGTWGAGGTTGVDLNTGVIGPLDTILGGTSTISTTSGTYSLTFTSGGGGDVNNAFWRFTATLLGNLTVSPTAGDATTYLNGYYLWANTTSGNFTVTLTTADGSVVLPQGRRGILYVSTAANVAPVIVAIAGSGTADPVPAGSSTIWYNSAAPSGWTAVAVNDYAIKVVSAGLAGVGSGSLGYSTVFNYTATQSHALLESEMPAHSHTVSGGVSGGASSGLVSQSGSTTVPTTATTITIGTTGGSAGHTHSMDMRVLTLAFTLCTRS